MKHLLIAAATLIVVAPEICVHAQPVIPVAAESSQRPSLAPLLKRVTPAVVNIAVTSAGQPAENAVAQVRVVINDRENHRAAIGRRLASSHSTPSSHRPGTHRAVAHHIATTSCCAGVRSGRPSRRPIRHQIAGP